MTTAGSVTALLQDAAKRSSSTTGVGSDAEQLIAVPAGLFGGFLASLAGKAIGGAIGGDTGEAIGGTAGGILGSILPFSVIPSGAPVSAPKAGGEDLVAVPAGFFGNLLKSIGGTVGDALGGDTGRAIGDVAGNVLGDILPFSVIPSGARSN
jgi:outer membrane lipoprotein SlyB